MRKLRSGSRYQSDRNQYDSCSEELQRRERESMTVEEAKAKLDAVLKKSRIHFYKPIQIAEILYYQRTVDRALDLRNLECYRTASRKWRDAVSVELLGNICTSSARFQDDLFNENAVPPEALYVLGQENIRTNGAVEAYIYRQFLML